MARTTHPNRDVARYYVVTEGGGYVSMTRANFRRFLREGAVGGFPYPQHFGVYLKRKPRKNLDLHAFEYLDWSAADFALTLFELDAGVIVFSHETWIWGA